MATPKYLLIPSALQEWKESWRFRQIYSRLRYLKTLIVPHPQFSQVIADIQDMTGYCIRLAEGDLYGVIAETGAGKTTVTKYFRERWRDRILPEVSIRRVCFFNVPPRPSSSTMSSALLHALGDPRWKNGGSDELENRCKTLLKKCRTRLVLIDNTHDIPERRRKPGVREVGNWMRSLVDDVPALLVCLGSEEARGVIEANSQARRRGPGFRRIDYFTASPDDKVGSGRLLRLLYEIDKKLPLAEMCGLSEPLLATRISIATNGVIDLIVKLLMAAIKICVKDRREKLSLNDLARAFSEIWKDGAPSANPFNPDVIPKPLIEPGEPFHLWLEDGYE